MSSGGILSMGAEGGFFILSATVLCCYEYAITFHEEVRCIWRRSLSGGSVLFVVNRYAMLAASLAGVIQFLPWNIQPLVGYSRAPYAEVCVITVRFIDACLILVNVTYAVFAALRMFALYNQSRLVLVLILFFGLLNPGAQIFLMSTEIIGTSTISEQLQDALKFPVGRINCSHLLKVGHEEDLGMLFTIFEYIFPALRIHALIFEIILIGLTWNKTINRRGLRKAVIRTPFTTMLLRDGTFYFSAIALASGLNIVGMLVYLVSGDGYTAKNMGLIPLVSAGAIVDAITSICMSRFILNLFAMSLNEPRSSLRASTSQGQTPRFACIIETIAENMGGDLRGGIVEDRDDDNV